MYLLLLFVSVALLGGLCHGDDTNNTAYVHHVGRYENWKCHPGYKGFTVEQQHAAHRCAGVLDEDCYTSCFRVETGMVKDGKWVDSVAKKEMAQMWTASRTKEADKWYADTKKCADDYEAKGKKFPMNFKGNCSDYKIMKDCVDAKRACVTQKPIVLDEE